MTGIRNLFFILLLLAAFASCQKDGELKEVSPTLKADSINSLAATPPAGNVLAVSGTLKITIQDSTYTFDAAKDSVAFVNVYLDEKKYFGLTAINKAHTMSFGISSAGNAAPKTTRSIAGSQFLLGAGNKVDTQYTLSQHAGIPDSAKISLIQYSRDSVLATGTFITYLAKDAKVNSPAVKVVGSFNLKKK